MVDAALRELGCWSPDAVNLVLGTIAKESLYGRYRRQVRGPALGIAQMEPATFEDIVDNFFRYHPDIEGRVMEVAGVDELNPEDLVENDVLSACMCRMQYYRFPDRIPSDVRGYALLWKKRYNTWMGKGTPEEFIECYAKYVVPDSH